MKYVKYQSAHRRNVAAVSMKCQRNGVMAAIVKSGIWRNENMAASKSASMAKENQYG
jgi:hypothetical protein